MAKYSVFVEVKHKKMGAVELREEYPNHDEAAAAYTLWDTLCHKPESVVASVTLVQHQEDTTIATSVKGSPPKRTPPMLLSVVGAGNANG